MRTDLPEIKTGKLKLREMDESDYLDYYEIGKDEETTKYLNWGPFKNELEALYILRDVILKRPEDNLPIGYAITIDGKMIGVIDYHTYDERLNSIEIGYVLKKDFWNKGIMTRCLKEAIKIAFEHLEVDKVCVGHTPENLASRAIILKCGFRYEKQSLAEMKNGFEPALYYSIYKEEFYRR